jgi:trimeric autotransporter adhesin
MKKIYYTYVFMTFLSLLFSVSVFGQVIPPTQPTPQDLPYVQDFSGLAATATTYPDGFKGWKASGNTTSIYNTLATLVGDMPLVASATAATSGAGVYNYDGKIGFLNTSSNDLAIGFAFTTLGKSGITVQYDAMVIRNPYDAAALPTPINRINAMVLQYRLSTTDPFVSVLSTEYSSTVDKQTTVTVAPLNPQTIKVTLPAVCNNQSLVQIRWISRQNGGSGGRPSFAIDNLSVTNDAIAPINTVGFPKIDNILSDGFDFSTKINKIGKTYFVLLASGSTKPSIAQIKLGQDADGMPALQSGTLTIADETLTYSKSFTGLTMNTSYTVFSVAEDSYGNTQTDSNQLDATTANVLIPSLTTTLNSLDFGFSEQNFNSKTLSYQIQGDNLTSGATLTATGDFNISKTQNTGFSTSLTFDKIDFDANASQTIYVRFSPNALGNFVGQITHQSAGATDKTVVLAGVGINPYVQNFNSTSVLSNSGWTEYSTAGNNLKWASTTTRFNSSPAAVQMNGFAETGASKDWLISPNLRLDSFGQFPLLSFYSRKFFAGPSLKLMISTNYDGTSSPETATWTALNGDFPITTGVFKQSKYINLENYKTDHTYLAWVYESTASGTNNNAEWTIDDVSITNESSFVASNPNLNFGEINPNTVSASQSFAFGAGGFGDITLTAPTDYQLSLDDTTFQSSIIVTMADALAGKTLYVRFTPSAKALNIAGAITITGTGLNQSLGFLTGSSLPKTETFDIVTYNLEFFGSNVSTAGTNPVEFGPIDDALQVENVSKVMNKLNADVYVVQEVSDETRLDELIQKISINGKTFDKSISPSWSYSFNAPDPNFPPQKLVVIYNTQTTTVKSTEVLFKNLFDDILQGTATLPNYPGDSKNFFASGRLPYLVNIETNIGGITKQINLIDLHARANSGTDITKYNMRKYDVEYLKTELDANYADANFMILGDYNDDVDTSVIAGNPSSYEAFVTDNTRYDALTLGISQGGAFSFLSSGGFLDHIITSNELSDEYVPNSIAVYNPTTDIPNYVNTTSDHGPVIARFELKSDVTLAKNSFESNGFSIQSYPNPVENNLNLVIKSNINKNLKLNFYDATGKIISNSIPVKATLDDNKTTLDVSNLHSGLYFYTLSADNKIIYSNKIIKK